MHHVRRRLRALEQLLQIRLPPNPLEQIQRLALKSLCTQDLEILSVMLQQAAETQSRELSECEAAACAAWEQGDKEQLR